jgi:hypothetical protein
MLGVMPDRRFRAVDGLIGRVQRVAAPRPDPVHILAQMITTGCGFRRELAGAAMMV